MSLVLVTLSVSHWFLLLWTAFVILIASLQLQNASYKTFLVYFLLSVPVNLQTYHGHLISSINLLKQTLISPGWEVP